MKIDPKSQKVHITPERKAIVAELKPGPPERIDGYSIGVAHMTQNAPHGGEVHPDGDEILYLISGRVDVTLEEESGDRLLELSPGDMCVVPKGLWHRVDIREPSHLVFLTPGPNGDHRPL